MIDIKIYFIPLLPFPFIHIPAIVIEKDDRGLVMEKIIMSMISYLVFCMFERSLCKYKQQKAANLNVILFKGKSRHLFVLIYLAVLSFLYNVSCKSSFFYTYFAMQSKDYTLKYSDGNCLDFSCYCS